jgi:DNA repair protein RecN (Recombination protein N)
MLVRLQIENVAVIEKAEVEFDHGFNVLTGETGAGKSIVIDAINLVLGERSNKEIIRTGANTASVIAVFDGLSEETKNQICELGYACEEDNTLFIQRDISADGKGTCRISGRLATVSTLKEIGKLLVNIHGQHDNQALLSAEKHIIYLDKYSLIENNIDEYRKQYDLMIKTKSELNSLKTGEEEKERRIDLLKYQINDIEAANLHIGEEEELSNQKALYLNSEKITSAVSVAYEYTYGGEAIGAQQLLSQAADILSDAEKYFPELQNISQRLSDASFEVEECISQLREIADNLEYNPASIDDIEVRLDTIFRLKRKYGNSAELILEYLNKAREELETYENSEFKIEGLTKKYNEYKSCAKKLAKEISKIRRESAIKMEQLVKDELAFLDMPSIKFVVSFDELSELSPLGLDKVEFLISANPGESPRPLAKIASGGELSRIMLSIKNVLADQDDIDTLIFDEIDSGVSGRAAQKIGMKLKQVSKGRQIICVTHLAQIASQADRHMLINKEVSNNRTFTTLIPLDFEGRKAEIARIMGGANITKLTLDSAEEMLKMSATNTN